VNTGEQSIEMNGLLMSALQGPITLLDNSGPLTAFQYDQNLYPFSVIEYSIVRGAARRVGCDAGSSKNEI
jgi:hypothetical protein